MFKAAVACSNPWDLLQCHVGLMSTWLGQGVYSKVMGGNMRKLFMAHKEELEKNEALDTEQVAKCRHLWEFDVYVDARKVHSLPVLTTDVALCKSRRGITQHTRLTIAMHPLLTPSLQLRYHF